MNDGRGRDYPDEGGGGGLLQTAPLSMSILALCVLIYIYANVVLSAGSGMFPESAAAWLTFSPGFGFYFPGIISHMFAHGSFGHLLGNMFMLFFFGTLLERSYGTGKYAVLYFGAGLAAAIAQGLATPEAVMLGASGALAGVMAAFVRHWPHVRLLIYGIIPMPAWLFVLLWLLYNLWGANGMLTGQVAYVAHLGGFACGLLLSYFFVKPGR